MLDFSNPKVWEQAMANDPKLKELAIKAGVENNSKRANELKGAFAWNCGRDVCKNEAERELCMYLFGYDSSIENAIVGRIIAANEAGETEF